MIGEWSFTASRAWRGRWPWAQSTFAFLIASSAATFASPPQPYGPPLTDDPVLGSLVAQALQQRPEIARAHALLDAEKQRIPQAGAFPDPSLTVGIQNDSFTKIQIGQMETSWVTIMATQTLPWYGKRGLRSELAGLAAQVVQADLDRAELTVRAEVEWAYVDLLLARSQLALLSNLEALWLQSEGLARTRYEVGEGSQSDLLRAQLERTRQRQRRAALESEERRRVVVLNRLRGRALDEAISTPRSLADIPDPLAIDVGEAVRQSEAQSPELKRASLSIEEADKRTGLARKDFFPDPALTAGVMPRGKLEPMWQVGVTVSLPVWAAFKQSPALGESELRKRAASEAAEALRRLLRQRIEERSLVLASLLQTNRLYRDGLLVQSEATVTSTLAQYQVGRVTFAAVLEALVGYLGDVNASLESAAAVQRIATAQRDFSLEPPGVAAASGMGGAGAPAAGAMGAAASDPAAPAQAAAETGASTPRM